MRHGFLLIDKPLGPTSHDVVGKMRKALSERNIGHLGTLDPQASGVLVLAVGSKALKTIELFSGSDKEYEVEITLGKKSTTYDSDGTITDVPLRKGAHEPTETDIMLLINKKFLGSIPQIPPVYSAIKIGGERAYRKARQGKAIAMPERTVHIDSCDIISYAYPMLRLRINCSAGTYMRSVAHDLGEHLFTGAYMSALRRTRVGGWTIDDAVKCDEASFSDIVPLKDALKGFPRFELSHAEWDHISHGRMIDRTCAKDMIGWHGELPVVILEPDQTGKKTKARKVL